MGINTDNSAPDGSAGLDVKFTNKGFLPPRMTFEQRTAIASPAEGLMVYQTDGVTGLYYYNGTLWTALSGTGVPSHNVGELFGGGIVFWVDITGQHGLIVSLVDISLSAQWSATYTTTYAVSTWNGDGNTGMILGISPAAQLCHNYLNSINYNTGTYSDWYLPAIDELNLIYNARYILNKNIGSAPAPTYILSSYATYWSSTEYADYAAWGYDFGRGYAYNYGKGSYNWVRAVRAF